MPLHYSCATPYSSKCLALNGPASWHVSDTSMLTELVGKVCVAGAQLYAFRCYAGVSALYFTVYCTSFLFISIIVAMMMSQNSG